MLRPTQPGSGIPCGEDSSLADESVRTLSYAVRPAVVLRVLGDLWLALAVLSLAPPLVALLAGEIGRVGWAALPALVFAALGLALTRGPAPERVQTNEALVIATLVFVLSPLVVAIPFAAAGLAPVDALFEAVSGITTTGLTTLAGVEGRSHAFLFTRAWTQWYGGLGIVVLSLALAMGPGVSARRLVATAVEEEDILGSARFHARRLLGVYALLTAAGIGLLLALGASFLDAVDYTLAAVSTGGFAPHDSSLGALARPAQAVVIGLCVAGAVSFPIYARVRRRGLRAVPADVELRVLVGAGLALAILLAGLAAAGWLPALPDAALLAFSAQTTAGFSSVDVSALAPASKLAVAISMAVGGSVGSTAGGIKLLRAIIVFQMVRWALTRTRLAPRAVAAPRLGGEVLGPEDAQRAFTLLSVFLATLLISWLPFLVAGYDPLDALFEVVSALGTVGLSTGITAPGLAPGLKAVLCADMLLGRLEILAVLVTLSPGTWLGRKAA